MTDKTEMAATATATGTRSADRDDEPRDAGAFRLELAAEERRVLLDIARWAVLSRLAEGEGGEGTVDPASVPVPPPGVLHSPLGAFVTFTLNGQLRGCIGSMTGDGPLYLTVARMAVAAAFEDPRFQPVTAGEVAQLHLDISVLGPLTRCPDPAAVRVGRHGLLVRQGFRSGVLLPQVPVEWGWDRETFLAQTCRKAGLPADALRDPRTELYWFEAEVFGDT